MDSAVTTLGTGSSYELLDRYRRVRSLTRRICEPLETEDFVIQSMPDVSPTRWHLAHTTWFFETFVLKPRSESYESPDDAFEFLFNSYYNTVGKQFPRPRRGLLSRPTVAEIWAYRSYVDEAMEGLLSARYSPDLSRVVELGLHHEQQHQELMLTDIKHVLSCNPLWPVYEAMPANTTAPVDAANWHGFAGGVHLFGHQGDSFSFDNECPRFEAVLADYLLQNRLTTNGEFLEFIEAGGYSTPSHWLSMGWATVEEHAWAAPLYWVNQDGEWYEFTLRGLQRIDLTAPVCHVSYFEADAFARWSGARLATELEWEYAARSLPLQGNFVESRQFHPIQPTAARSDQLQQCFGDVWEWTSSPYAAYPGYAPTEGALGEYNGKFMCNQFVLRGGSCATSQSHIRATYRNFFPPEARWQFSGIRLAQTEST